MERRRYRQRPSGSPIVGPPPAENLPMPKASRTLAVLALLPALAAFGCSSGSHANADGGVGGAGGASASGGKGGAGGIGLGSGNSSSGGLPTTCAQANEHSSSGCDYYVVMPDVSSDATGGCFAAFV